MDNMKVRIDQAGRIVVPKALRERLGFRPGTSVEVIEQPEGVLGAPRRPRNWQRVLDDVRQERLTPF